MDRKTMKKHARELYEIMGIWETINEFGGWVDTAEIKAATITTGKRLRQLFRPEVVAYFNQHEGVKLHADAKFNANRKYQLYADHNYRCGSGDDVDLWISRR